MVHALLIVAFVVVLMRDGLGRPSLLNSVGPWWAAIAPAAVMGVAWGAAHLLIAYQGMLMDRHGRASAVIRADRALTASRVAATGGHVAGVLWLGSLDATRLAIGDLVLVDELVSVLPLLVMFAAGWWSIYPIERRVREAVLLRQLDEGRPLHAPPTRGAYVWSAVRHQLALVVVPIALILAWGESAAVASERLGWPSGYVRTRGGAVPVRELVVPLVQVVGVAAVFTLMPLVVRHLWDTVRLGPGPLRDGLTALCRAHRVRVRDLLVWRTRGSMLNGAVMGVIGPARYILLTDALLESMTPGQVEAVTAHEVGHVRRHHMAWLGAAALAGVFGTALAAERLAHLLPSEVARGSLVQGSATVISLAAGLLVFGVASRRFEWQADAFAVQHLSGWRGPEGGAVVITPESVAHMTSALQRVAELNNVPARRWSWRHGSIALRQRKLASLVGRPADRLTVDREARAVKIISALALAGVAGVTAAEFWTL